MRPDASRSADAAPLRVVLYAGMCVEHDAVSASARHKLTFLRELRDAGAPVDVAMLTHGSTFDDPDIIPVPGVHEAACTAAYRDADVHIFEFGIRYDLFNAMLVVPDDRAVLAVYHNITPPSLVDDDGLRQTLEASLVQKHNLWRAATVVCCSEFSRDDLVEFGIEPERLRVLHLPPAIHRFPPPSRAPDVVDLLFVGRLVQSKGVVDLARAFVALPGGGPRVRLTLAGNAVFSSTSCIDTIRGIVASAGMTDGVRIVDSPSDEALARLYASSDALVVPSYHEGYCVPVVEAYSAGCQVIAYDSTNLPNVTGRLGTLVPTGDVGALGGAMADLIRRAHARRHGDEPTVATARGEMTRQEWERAVREHLADYTFAAYRRRFLDILCDSAPPRAAAAAEALRVRGGAGLRALAGVR